jgi:hypothetical protein
MNTYRALAALTAALTLSAVAPARASSVLTGTTSILRGATANVSSGNSNGMSGTSQASLAGTGGTVLLNTAGFVRGSQVFSDAITVPAAGTLTVTLAGISWLDALQNLNCFVTAPGGGIIGNATNGTLDSVQVQPGTIYVNWYARASAPLFLGAYSLAVNFQPAAPPPPTVPLPPTLLLLASGLAALVFGLRRLSLRSAMSA